MSVYDQIRMHLQQMNELKEKLGLLSLEVYEPLIGNGPTEPVFVVDLDTARQEAYADRYFETMFGLQRIFAHPVDMWERHMFEKDSFCMSFRLVPSALQHAA